MPYIAHVPRARRGQWNLIGSLVAIALLIGLTAWLLPKMIKPGTGHGDNRTSIQMGQGAACSIYQGQINDAVTMYKSDHDGQPPASLEDLKKQGVTDDILHAPGCSFQMGPGGVVTETGRGAAPSAAPHNPLPGAPVTLGSPPPASAPAPPPAGTTVAPGGIRVPTGSPPVDVNGGN